MATIKHTVSKSVRTNAGTVGGTAYVLEGTNAPQDFAADVSTIVSLAIEWSPSTGSSSCSIFTNEASTGTPDDTLTLLADKPLYWDTRILATEGTACPLTVDIDGGLFITTTVVGDLTIAVLFDGS
jgi:hypothetical protein